MKQKAINYIPIITANFRAYLHCIYWGQCIGLIKTADDIRNPSESICQIQKDYDKNTLFLFCGKRTNRIKGLLWEGDGFLLLYKRLDNGAFSWPRSAEEALEISSEQYAMLMQGLYCYPPS